MGGQDLAMWSSMSSRYTLGLQDVDIGIIAHNQDFIVSGSHGNIAGDVGEEFDKGVGDCVPLEDALVVRALKEGTARQYILVSAVCSYHTEPLRRQTHSRYLKEASLQSIGHHAELKLFVSVHTVESLAGRCCIR